MKRIILLSVLFVTIAFAQYPMMNMGPGEFNPVQGAWAEYDMTNEDGEDYSIRYAIVGEGDCEGVDCYWFEYRSKDKKTGEKGIFKILTAGDPNKQEYTMRMIVQNNDDTPMEFVYTVSEEQIEAAEEYAEEHSDESDDSYDDFDDSFKEIGTKKITVPAGTFDCRHFQVIDENNAVSSEFWLSEKVVFMGIVKSSDNDGTDMVLTAYGNSGAESEITKTADIVEIPTSAEDYYEQLGESAKEGMKEGVKEGVKEGAKDAAKEGVKRGIKSLIGF